MPTAFALIIRIDIRLPYFFRQAALGFWPIGHSTGGGEVVHYIGRHGSKRVAKAALKA